MRKTFIKVVDFYGHKAMTTLSRTVWTFSKQDGFDYFSVLLQLDDAVVFEWKFKDSKNGDVGNYFKGQHSRSLGSRSRNGFNHAQGPILYGRHHQFGLRLERDIDHKHPTLSLQFHYVL